MRSHLKALSRFLILWLISSPGVGLFKTWWEVLTHTSADGLPALPPFWEMAVHNTIVDGVIVGLLASFTVELLLQLYEVRKSINELNQKAAIEAGKKISDQVNDNLKVIADKTGEQIESIAAEAKEYINKINGIYTTIDDTIRSRLKESNIYVAGVRKLDSDIVHLLGQAAHRFASEPDGVLILKSSSVVEYSEVCKELLAMANRSVWSMSDMGLDQTFMLYCKSSTGLSAWDSSGTEVRDWIEEVNAKANSLDIKRIQVVNADRMALINSLKAYEISNTTQTVGNVLNVIRPSLRPDPEGESERVNTLLEGWNNYVELYANGAGIDNWYVYDLSDSYHNDQRGKEHCAIGEFIIFDERYLVRYSSQTAILEILVGKVVEIFARQFNNKQSLNVHSVSKSNITAKELSKCSKP